METIFAQSSAFGKAGVAVFRISGIKSLEVLEILTGKKDFKPRLMYYQKIISPESGDLIDNAMIVYFKKPHSFNGEDVAEMHTRGSKAISVMLMNALLNIPNVRLAEEGEFTKRAFLNNKFDLTAAEGIADLINAETIM